MRANHLFRRLRTGFRVRNGIETLYEYFVHLISPFDSARVRDCVRDCVHAAAWVVIVVYSYMFRQESVIIRPIFLKYKYGIRMNNSLHIPEFRLLNTFYHTRYGRILSVRLRFTIHLTVIVLKHYQKNDKDYSIKFARLSKWGCCIDGEMHIEDFNEELYNCICTGFVRQNTF